MNRRKPKIRKPIEQLTAADLVRFPIWEFAMDEEGVDGQDETWVRPAEAKTVGKGLWSLSVAAEFKTHRGVQLEGFIELTTAQKVAFGPAVLLADGKYIFVGTKTRAERAEVAVKLGLPTPDVFPLAFTLKVLIAGEKKFRSGVIG